MSRGTAKDQLEYEQYAYMAAAKQEEMKVLQWTPAHVLEYAERDMQELLRHLLQKYPEHLSSEDDAANVLQVVLNARLTVRDNNLRFTAARNAICAKFEELARGCEEKAAKAQQRVELGKRKRAERAQAKLAAEGITDPDAAVEGDTEQAAKRPTPIPALSLADLSTASVREQLPGPSPLALSPPQDDSVQEQLMA